jgi:hypothetical protein
LSDLPVVRDLLQLIYRVEQVSVEHLGSEGQQVTYSVSACFNKPSDDVLADPLFFTSASLV